jgi:hypothetical protein
MVEDPSALHLLTIPIRTLKRDAVEKTAPCGRVRPERGADETNTLGMNGAASTASNSMTGQVLGVDGTWGM